ncbi:hypothetical protein LIER_05964 [Lithospermum erythrorhizon]|uniref:Retrotransposon gag protein n=1 Tax=Lithospermum erythrorhizon TaxID=34254 RepID=A0AAV3P2T1_LITER
MCIQGIHWDLQYILQGILLKTFEQLSTRAHYMELTIVTNKGKGTCTSTTILYKAKIKDVEFEEPYNLYKAKVEDVEFEEPYKEDVHSIISKSTKFSFKTKRTQGDTNFGRRSRPTLKEMEAKEYPFFDSDTPVILEELLKEKLTEFPESKRPEEANRSSKPNFCKYHPVLGHSTEKCFTFKEKVVSLARQ